MILSRVKEGDYYRAKETLFADLKVMVRIEIKK
jgi:hypothetical protein